MGADSWLDAGTGAFQGGATGGMLGSMFVGKGAAAGVAATGAAGAMWPVAVGAGVGALGMGALSYFGGAGERKTEKRNNALAFKSMEQDLELGEFKIGEARRQKAIEIDQQKKKEAFGRLLAQYFQQRRK